MGIKTPDDPSPEIHDDERLAESSAAEAGDGEHVAPASERDVEVEGTASTAPVDTADTQMKIEGFEREEPAGQSDTIQINLTPLITLVIGLGLGFLAGFVGRPRLISAPQIPIATTPESVTQSTPAVTPESVSQATSPATSAETSVSPSPAATNDPATREATVRQIMDTLIAQTRHFRGDPNAPVTILEFSDFQ